MSPRLRSVSDRPGRYFALLVMSPILVLVGMRVGSSRSFKKESLTLISLGILLFFYELFWVSRTGSELVLLEKEA